MSTLQAVPDAFRHVQGLVRSVDQLHGLLANSTQAATPVNLSKPEEKDDGRGSASGDAVQIWRPGVRSSDELVRVLTEFSSGWVLRDVRGAPDGSPAHHLRMVTRSPCEAA